MKNAFQNWMKMAIEEAAKTQLDVPVGCVIVRPAGSAERAQSSKQALVSEQTHSSKQALVSNGQEETHELLASAHNQREETNDPTAHAEILALREAARVTKSWRLNGTVLLTTLEPCPMCAEAIIQARVSTIVFGAYDPKSGACGSAFNLFVDGRSYPLPEIIGGIEEQECQSILEAFFKKTVRGRN